MGFNLFNQFHIISYYIFLNPISKKIILIIRHKSAKYTEKSGNKVNRETLFYVYRVAVPL